jgi:hypothetical protein
MSYACGHYLSNPLHDFTAQDREDIAEEERRTRFLNRRFSSLQERLEFKDYRGWITRKNPYTRAVLFPGSSFTKFWELLGFILLLLQLVNHFHPGIFHRLFRALPVTDVYFVLDIFIRTRTGYYDEESGELVLNPDRIYKRYLHSGWLIFDVLLSIPYQALWIVWRYSAALRLATVHRSRAFMPFGSILTDGQFRLRLMQSMRDYWREFTFIEDMLKKESFNRSSVWQKSLHIIVNTIRTPASIRTLERFRRTMHFSNTAIMSLRTYTVFSRTMESQVGDRSEKPE